MLLRPHPGPFLLRLLLGHPHSHLQVCLSRRRQIIFNYLFLGTSNSRGPPLNSSCPMSFRVSAGHSVEILESLIMGLLIKACSRNNGTEQGWKSTQRQITVRNYYPKGTRGPSCFQNLTKTCPCKRGWATGLEEEMKPLLSRGQPRWRLREQCSAFSLLPVIFCQCLLLVKLTTGQRARGPEEAVSTGKLPGIERVDKGVS